MLSRILLFAGVAVLAPATVLSQGPLLSYLAAPETQLPWASCRVLLQGGSAQRVPFLPVVTAEYAPLGTARYTRDVRISAPLLFAGNGVDREAGPHAYGGLDASGRVVFFSYDFPDAVNAALETEVTLADRIREAARRGAAAVVAFSARDDAPFPRVGGRDAAAIPEIPAIAVNRRSAEIMLAAAGVEAGPLFEKWRTEGAPASRVLIARLELRIDGAFRRVERPDLAFVFEPGIGEGHVRDLASLNEQSLSVMRELFGGAAPSWPKSAVTYFRDFDSKLFYTHHWGRGLSAGAGSFMVFDPATVSLGLAVHENTHTLLTTNWGNTSSFMNEGFARYAESAATDRDRDHAAAAASIAAGTMPALADIVMMNIGSDAATDRAYPAAGSFVFYLVQRYGLAAARRAWTLENRARNDKAQNDTWVSAFDQPLAALERDWQAWLIARRRR